MSYPMSEISDGVEALADDASTLLESTVNAAVKGHDEARKALDNVLERGRSIYGVARRRAVKDRKLVDGAIHDHIYPAIAMGMGIGLILGYVLSRSRD